VLKSTALVIEVREKYYWFFANAVAVIRSKVVPLYS